MLATSLLDPQFTSKQPPHQAHSSSQLLPYSSTLMLYLQLEYFAMERVWLILVLGAVTSQSITTTGFLFLDHRLPTSTMEIVLMPCSPFNSQSKPKVLYLQFQVQERWKWKWHKHLETEWRSWYSYQCPHTCTSLCFLLLKLVLTRSTSLRRVCSFIQFRAFLEETCMMQQERMTFCSHHQPWLIKVQTEFWGTAQTLPFQRATTSCLLIIRSLDLLHRSPFLPITTSVPTICSFLMWTSIFRAVLHLRTTSRVTLAFLMIISTWNAWFALVLISW